MKKLTLLICALLALAANAQNFRGGAFAGVSVSQIDGDRCSGYYQPGLIIGASVDRALSEKFSLAMELKFLQKGAREIVQETDRYYKVRLNYIQVPVLAQYRIWSNFIGEAGLGFAFLINAKEDFDGYGYERTEDYRRFELAGIFGVAYDIPKLPLRLGARFSYSILPVRKIENVDPIGFYDQTAQYNNNLEFALTYFFTK
ncbi:MAG: PorT family protein [Prevotellaceae bacterium]|jgi:hypothetical protein|nr:PorT family protein [Prevotellaceae bacterium]